MAPCGLYMAHTANIGLHGLIILKMAHMANICLYGHIGHHNTNIYAYMATIAPKGHKPEGTQTPLRARL